MTERVVTSPSDYYPLYEEKLSDILNQTEKIYIFGEELEITEINSETVSYAVKDINRDGIDELLVKADGGRYANDSISVYSYNPNNERVIYFGNISAHSDFFSNGLIKREAFHGSDYGESLYPFCVVKHDFDGYYEPYSFYCIDKSACEEAGHPEDFDEYIDEDKDGVIYYANYIGEDSEYEGPMPLTKEELDTIYSYFYPVDEPMKIEFTSLSDDNKIQAANNENLVG